MVTDSSTRNFSAGERSNRAVESRCTPRGLAMASNSFLPCNRRRVALMMCVTAFLSMARVQQTSAFMLTPRAAADAALSRSRASTLRRARAQDRHLSPGTVAENSGRGQSVCRGWRNRVTTTTRVTAVANSKEVIGDNVGYAVDAVVGKCDLESLPPLKNRYYALRHGQSVANMEGIISSDPRIGAVSHGLTTNGRAQARRAATALIEEVGRDRLDSLVFISSGFLRARQTAEECRAALQNIVSFECEVTPSEECEAQGEAGWDNGSYDVCPPVVVRQELRERSFGDLDGTILVNYNKVWPEDLKDGSQDGYGVESVCDVAARIGGLVRSLEEEYDDASIVFSSHADTLQIAQCHIAGADERLFSQYRFKNGEVRSLLQDTGCLPPPNPLSFK